jgi:hypothetical protein
MFKNLECPSCSLDKSWDKERVMAMLHFLSTNVIAFEGQVFTEK